MRQTFEIPLDIPDVTIENVTTNRIGHIEITVKSTVEGTPCHRCGKMTTQFYGEDREITLRHFSNSRKVLNPSNHANFPVGFS